jgi:hypothetical protein
MNFSLREQFKVFTRADGFELVVILRKREGRKEGRKRHCGQLSEEDRAQWPTLQLRCPV